MTRRHIFTILAFVVSLAGLVLGIATIVGSEGFASKLGFIKLTIHDPIRPLIVSLVSAAAFLLWSALQGRPLRRAWTIAWLTPIVGCLLIALLNAFFDTASAESYPIGDGAFLEIYTLHAIRGIWTLGPYSQFGWHHPGPMFFYLLAPAYMLSEEKTIALHVGAFAINLLSMVTIAVVLVRCARPAVACVALIALAIFVWRVESLLISYWNPHVIVLPVVALLAVCAALAAGRRGALPAIVFVGSFLAQTHVSLVPLVIALAGAALAATARWRDWRSLRRWINLSAWLLLVLWLFPIVEELSHRPGNLTSLVEFFLQPSPGQPLSVAMPVWGDMMCGFFLPMKLPVGWPLKLSNSYVTATIAALQLLLLAVAAWEARRRQDHFNAALCALGALASVVMLWSITKIRTQVGEYMVFWMSAIGTLNWAVLLAIALARLGGLGRLGRFVPTRVALTRVAHLRRPALAVSAIVLCVVTYLGATQLEQTRRDAFRPLGDSAKKMKRLTQAVLQDLQREHVQRPRIDAEGPWGEAAGLVLQLYKRGLPLAVNPDGVFLYGEPLAPNGQEDRVYVIADPRTHDELARQTADDLIAHEEGVYVHASSRR